jgi:hypothetical protein
MSPLLSAFDVEGDRALAQAPDHRVAAGLDALGDGDLALAGEQFDRTHLAKIHADGIVGAIDRLLLLLDDVALALAGLAAVVGAVVDLGFVAVLVVGFLGLDDVDAHLAQRGHDVLDLLVLVLRQRLVQLVISDVAALLAAGDQLLDRRIVEVDQRRIAAFLLLVRFDRHIRLRHCNAF